MFNALRKKLGNVLSKISKKVEEEPSEEIVEEKNIEEPKKKAVKEEIKEKEEKIPFAEEKEKVEEKKGFFSKIFKKKEETTEEAAEGPKGIFGKVKQKILTQKITAEKFDELFFELEVALLENNVAVEVIDKIKQDLKTKLVDQPIKRGAVLSVIQSTLKESVVDIFSVEQIDIIKEIKNKKDKPYVIVFVGVNGSGKTTTIAKIAFLIKQEKLKPMLVAGDTWRSAAIQQLEEHGKNLNIRVVKHDYGGDPAAVAFDGIKAAKANNMDVVLIDTAGRQQSNVNLMRELEKIIRISKPDLKLFIGESITGNDCIIQAQEFNTYVDLDGFILTKADVDEKGGTALSIGYVLKKPILYFGVGQEYKDLEKFKKETVIAGLGL